MKKMPISTIMDHYEKGEVVEVDDAVEPFLHLGVRFGDVTTMIVRNSSKIRNLLHFASKKMEENANKSIIFVGVGQAITKTVTCVEILKKEFKSLHQINKAYFRRIEEYWEPREAGLERLKVNKDIPVLAILLSKDALNNMDLGYQEPGSLDVNRRRQRGQDKLHEQHEDGCKQSVNRETEGQGSMARRKRLRKKDQISKALGGDRTDQQRETAIK